MHDAIGIGSLVWVFDINHRVYPKPLPGRIYTSGPIWRGHWVKHKIAAETSRSWITDFGRKIPKKGSDPRCIAFSEEDVDRRVWVNDHRYLIGRAVGATHDFETLQAVAKLIGYLRA